MPRSVSLPLTCVLALLLGACDRQSSDSAQPQETEAAAKADLTGTLDRSFAGDPIPAVELVDPAGTTLALAEMTGKPMLLNLWATWCVPCVVEMPMLDELAGEMGEEVRFVTVSEDMKGAELVAPFFKEKGFKNLPQWMDPQNDLAIQFGGGAALPLTVMYDAQGKEVWRVIGGYDWSSEEARALLTEALAAGK
jgi:thiol-disulfide isomerase/thioredoxin